MSKLTKFWKGFWLAAAISAGVALVALSIFWVFISAYENSRPQVAIDAYVREATPERISQKDTAIPEACDLSLQKEEDARKVIAANVSAISCLRDAKRTTDEKLVYAIMTGGKRVGSLTLTVVEKDFFGLEHWRITEEVYDFSHLLGEAVSVSVPEGYQVYADGVLLDGSYVTEKDVQFENLKPFYADHKAPTLQTYTAGRILGTPKLSVKDQNGQTVDITSDATIQASFDNCTEEEKENIKTFAETYVKAYMRFSSGYGGRGMRYINYNNMARHMVSGCDLAKRLKNAIEGLYYAVDHRAEVLDMRFHQFICMEEGVYMCDLTYTVRQNGRTGKVESDMNLRLVVRETENGLKTENMVIY